MNSTENETKRLSVVTITETFHEYIYEKAEKRSKTPKKISNIKYFINQIKEKQASSSNEDFIVDSSSRVTLIATCKFNNTTTIKLVYYNQTQMHEQ